MAKSGQSEKFEKVGAVLRIRVERLRAHVGNNRLELLERRSQPDRLFPFRGAQMSSRGRRHDSVAHRERENFFQTRDVKIARSGAEAVLREPRIAFAWPDLRHLRQPAGRPVALDSANDERFPLNRFRLLMPDRQQITVAKRVERQLALRAINLPLFVAEVRQLAPGKRWIGCFQAALDLLALNPDASIIDPV